MTKNIIIAGSGFAGLWAAISAASAVALTGKETEVAITVVSPAPKVTIRTRLYEAVLYNMTPDISDLLEVVGVRQVGGRDEVLDAAAKTITTGATDGSRKAKGKER